MATGANAILLGQNNGAPNNTSANNNHTAKDNNKVDSFALEKETENETLSEETDSNNDSIILQYNERPGEIDSHEAW
ncbi:9438_t:CDS:2 [Dentiscutata heterogama]|uniref:9438_t:CDS:1 n=1 Tax=Dentiscutata heterogama TaxID=1316150 RepID=A0ACA9L523_9GLOM|nr:9438_t:CDS:2 [Dentiscutata heterogama]